MTSRIAVDRLAALVKAKRGKQGLRDTAKEIGGVSPSTLSRIEQGKTPDFDTFMKLCDWLEIAPGEFFNSENNESSLSDDAKVPIRPGASTPEIIEAYLRADKELDPQTAEALAEMVSAAYRAVVDGKIKPGK